jgi:hypothetical protein
MRFLVARKLTAVSEFTLNQLAGDTLPDLKEWFIHNAYLKIRTDAG